MRVAILRSEHDSRTDALLKTLFVQSVVHLAFLHQDLVLHLHILLGSLAKLLTFTVKHWGLRLLQRHLLLTISNDAVVTTDVI